MRIHNSHASIANQCEATTTKQKLIYEFFHLETRTIRI